MGKILAPLNDLSAFPRYVASGVGELYVGFADAGWVEHFGQNAPLNRMSGFGQEANPFTLGDIVTLSDRCREADVDLFVTFNSTSYTAEQTDYITQNHLPILHEAGITGIIVSTPELISHATARGIECVASTIANICNADIAGYYREQGITRAVIPRDVGCDEITSMKEAHPDLEYEVFLMRNGCVFSDALCLGLHKAGKPSLCRSLRQAPCRECATGATRDEIGSALENGSTWRHDFHVRTCGLCSLWRFESLGIDSYKIVGRGDHPLDLCRDISLISKNIAIAHRCDSEHEYLRRMMRPHPQEDFCRTQGLSCYYPEVMFG